MVFFNKSFDLEFLDNELKKANLKICLSSSFQTTCAQEIVMSSLNRQKNVSLDVACKMYDVDISERTIHGALVDAKLTAQLFLILSKTTKYLAKVPHKKARRKPEKFPLPKAYQGYQINFCKNPKCKNYGVLPKFPDPMKPSKFSNNLGSYMVKNVNSKEYGARKVLHCKLCNSSSVVFSNKSVVQELKRVRALYALDIPSCPNTGLEPNKKKGIPDGRRFKLVTKQCNGRQVVIRKLKPACRNHSKDIYNHTEKYWFDSNKTKPLINKATMPMISYPDSSGGFRKLEKADSQTFKCKSCETKFTARIDPHKGQHNHQVNEMLFSMLVNKAPLNRIAEMLSLNMSVIYARIEFFYKQCIQFEQFILTENLYKLKNRELCLSLDKQTFFANWSSRRDARRTPLVNTSSVDNNTRYVLASNLNFDFTTDYQALTKEFIRIGEYAKEPFKRRYQQYILPDEALMEAPDSDVPAKTPAKHLLLQQSYSVITHLEMLKPFLESAHKVNLYADNDMVMDSAITKVYKDLIIAEKLQACTVRKSKLELGETEMDKGFRWVAQEMPIVDGKYLDLKLLTDCDAAFMENASLHGVDNFFNILRRRLSMVERPIRTPRNNNDQKVEKDDLSAKGTKFEKWNLYGAYNPKYVLMLIEICRVFNNFVLTDWKGIQNQRGNQRKPKTPAQKMGLVDQDYTINDILSFSITSIVTQFKALSG